MTVFWKILVNSTIYQDSARLVSLNSSLPRLSRKNSLNHFYDGHLSQKSRKLKFSYLEIRKFDEIDHFSSWCRPDSRCLVIWYCSLDFLEQPYTKSFWPLRVIWSKIAFYEKLIFQNKIVSGRQTPDSWNILVVSMNLSQATLSRGTLNSVRHPAMGPPLNQSKCLVPCGITSTSI